MTDMIFVGEDKPGSRTAQRLRTMRAMDHAVRFVRAQPEGETHETPPTPATRLRYRLRRPADRAGVNRSLVAAAESGNPPDVVWLDNAQTVRPATLRRLRAAWPKARLIWYAEDDMLRPRNRSVWVTRSIPLFDLWVTTKSYNARPEEIPAMGARKVLFVNNSYDPDLHRPIEPTDDDRARFAAGVSFVGSYEPERAGSLDRLAEAGIAVRVWGNGWPERSDPPPGLTVERRPVYGRDLAAVYTLSAINLAFLRKANRDLQTCRTIEIPASGGFMLHEGNDEVRALLAPDREAAFFETDEDLVAACRRWLDLPEERKRVAAAGRARVTGGGFSHADRIAEILDAAGCA